ncbi:zinc-binding dehydrogenase [Pectinatus frisingensis]|jgi:threonine dehydrogenase-like Zn-dependent dehydrogenase|uniref:zinc-binding dehydrogenase n=1 Tax=Pectinatus frisingensis TaxID=865 RepID=UPI0015F44C14|nr:zinc-binding dehydrogenase [Pectinatus frisingensis]
MITTAVRMYGKNDLRLEKFSLPEIKDDEILVKVISDSICMSTYKESKQGSEHKRVPEGIDKHPVIVGHETAGDIVEVGSKWQHKYCVGDKFSLQPALTYKGQNYTVGYCYENCGGACTYAVIPSEVIYANSLLSYKGTAYYEASLSEPMSCIIGAFHAAYHNTAGEYKHVMGTKKNGTLAILAGAGPMGMGAIDYALHSDVCPKILVVTDINAQRLERASQIFPIKSAAKKGIKLYFINTAAHNDPITFLRSLTDGHGFDDIFVLAPIAEIIEQADKLLSYDGCLNFFSGPINTNLSANINFYNIHYNSAHMMGTSGGYTSDMLESLSLSEQKRINPAVMVTHICGINDIIDTTINLPHLPGGKKLSYPQIKMELTAIDSFAEKGKDNPFFAKLAEICQKYNNLWNAEAEDYLLKNWPIKTY